MTIAIGDRVTYSGYHRYGEGTVIHIKGKSDSLVLVEFDSPSTPLHSGEGRGKSNNCWWCLEEHLLPAGPPLTTEQLVLKKIKVLDERYAARMKLKQQIKEQNEYQNIPVSQGQQIRQSIVSRASRQANQDSATYIPF